MLATLFLLLSSWIPWVPSLCCTESEDSSDFELSEFFPATALTTQDWAYPASTKTEDTEYHLLHTMLSEVTSNRDETGRSCETSGHRVFQISLETCYKNIVFVCGTTLCKEESNSTE